MYIYSLRMVTCLCMFIQYKHDFQLATKHWKIWKRNNLVQCGKSEITLRVYSAATTPMRDRKGRNFHSCFKIKAFKASCKGLCDLGQPEETLQIPTVDIIMNICGNYNCDILWYDIMCVAMDRKNPWLCPIFPDLSFYIVQPLSSSRCLFSRVFRGRLSDRTPCSGHKFWGRLELPPVQHQI
jgi:hypothetical protein